MEISNFRKTDTHDVLYSLCMQGSEWEDCLLAASAQVQAGRQIQGFRPGKAPLDAVLGAYGELVYAAAAQLAFGQALKQVCEEHQLDPISEPVYAKVIRNREGIRADGCFTSYPEITELNYKGITVVKPVMLCTEEKIDEEIEKFRFGHLNVHEVERDAQIDDIVEVSFTGTHEGMAFPYDHNDKSRFRLGSGQLFAGLDEALLGKKAGDRLQLTLTMPEDFHREEIRGFVLDLDVTLRSVCARELWPLDDAFVQKYVKDCTTVAEFREKVREQVQRQYDAACERRYQQNLSHAIARTVTCFLPENMILMVEQNMLDALGPAAAQQQMTILQLLEAEGRTVESYLAQCRPIAIDKVRRSLALEYVADTENLQVTPEEYRRRLAAESGGRSLEETERVLGGPEEVTEMIRMDKARKRIEEYAEVIEEVVGKLDAYTLE